MRAAAINRRQSSTPGIGSIRPGKLVVRHIAPPKRRGGVGPAIVWTGVGFIAGAIFWHAVGFWTFVSSVVLNGPAEPGKVALAESRAAVTSDRPPNAFPTIYRIDPANCTALVLDRLSNRTEVHPCPENGLALRLQPDSNREDAAVTAPRNLQAADYHAK